MYYTLCLDQCMTTTHITDPAPVSTKQFTWNPTTRQFVGEISSTNGFARCYIDACDEGLTLVSARTGRAVVFVIDSVLRTADEDREIISWTLVPREDFDDVSASIVLFND